MRVFPSRGWGVGLVFLVRHQQQQHQRKASMHYKNGREAKNGDKIVLLPPAGCYGMPVAGILYDAKAEQGSDYNGRIAVPQPTDTCADLKNCLHADDIAGPQALIPDLTKEPATIPPAQA
jgi:hypothetical protein